MPKGHSSGCEVDNSEVVSERISMWGKLLVKTGWEQGSRLLFFDTEAYELRMVMRKYKLTDVQTHKVMQRNLC